MIPALAAAVLLCSAIAGPLVITEPGTYDFRCGGVVEAGSRSAVKVLADDVELIGLTARNSYECVEVRASRVTIRGGLLETCAKHAVSIGASDDVTVEGVTIRDSGNGVASSVTGGESADRLRIVGNYFANMGGSVDGHAVGIQSTISATIAHNVIVGTQNDAIAVYWKNRETVQTGVVVERNAIYTSGPGITFRATNGESRGRWNNVARDNTVISPEPLMATGAETDSPQRWSVEMYDNYAPGRVLIRSTGKWCPRVYVRDNFGAVYEGWC